MSFPRSLLSTPLVRVVLAPLRWFASLKWRYRLLLMLALIVGVGVPVGLLWKRERDTARQLMIAEAWRRFDKAVELENHSAAEALLAQLAELTRHDPVVEARLQALRQGMAAENDPKLARMLLTEHLRAGNWAEAAREAEKALTANPGDMLARGVLARRAVNAGQPDVARTQLAAMASPFDNADTATPGALLLTVGLMRELGEDDSALLSFIATRLVPILKSRQAERFPFEAKLQLLQCYHLACDALDRYPELSEYWVPGARLIEQLKDNPARASAVALVREGHLAVIYRLRRTNALPASDVSALIAEFDEQVLKSWSAVQAQHERDPLPYVGLALAHQRRGESAEARRWLDRGLSVCPEPRELYLVLGRLMQVNDPRAAGEILERAYERYPRDPAIAPLLAETVAAAGRPDRAVEICRAARRDTPDLRWACRLEASLCLKLGRPTQALEALAPLRPTMISDPAAMELFVRAACAVGADAAVDELLGAEPRNKPLADARVAAARGYLAAARLDEAIRHAKLVTGRFPDHVAARSVAAEGLRLRAEAVDSPRWPAERVREALDALDWLRRRDPGNRLLAQRIAWLQLKGLGSAELALRSAAPLLDETTAPSLTPEMAETVGAVLLANGKTEDSLRWLNRALDAAPSRVESYLLRATALRKLGRRADAKADLDRAATLPRTPRQIADWQKVSQDLEGLK